MPTGTRTLPDIDTDTPYTIRTPHLQGRYAAQLWGRSGYWEVGRYELRRHAKAAARWFLYTDPTEPEPGSRPPQWHVRRSDSHRPADGHRWVRRVKGDAWQSRYWLPAPVGGGGCNLNLGLFTQMETGDQAEWVAARTSEAFHKLWQGATTIGQTVAKLKAKRPVPWVPEDVEVPLELMNVTRPTVTGEPSAAKLAADRLRSNLFGFVVTEGEIQEHWELSNGWGRTKEWEEELTTAIIEDMDAEEGDRLPFDALVDVVSC